MAFPGFSTLIKKVPGGKNVQVFVGTLFSLGVCAIPVIYKETRAGHDLFSQEKPEEIILHQEKQQKDYIVKKIAERKA